MKYTNPGSIYAIQQKLEEEPELPELYYKDNDALNVITRKSLGLKRSSGYSENLNNIFWTNDIEENIDKVYKTNTNKCNLTEMYDKTQEEYDQNLYRYHCYKYKRVYYIPIATYNDCENIIQQNVSFIVNTPLFNESIPYIYYPELFMFGKKFNFFNTYFSRHLLEYLKKNIINWFNSIEVTDLDPKDYLLITGVDIGQIYVKINKIRLGLPVTDDNSDIKIQLNIKNEYYFWAIENIKKNYMILYELGLDSFKFATNLGEEKIFSNQELYPNYQDESETKFIDLYFEEYNFKDKIYKRELLNPPNIVIYLKTKIRHEQGGLSLILNKLTQMFPDDLLISDGVSRFNIRFSKNVFFSLGGDNQYKFDKDLVNHKIIPLEYQTIINIANDIELTSAQYNKLNEYSTYISGHEVLKYHNGKYKPNNIISYLNLLPVDYNSFQELFEDNLLFDEGLIRFTPLPEFLLNNDNIFPLSIINRYYPAIRNAGKIESSKKHKKSKKNNKKNTKKSKKTYTK
jgi:hypothetical protein